MKILVVGSTGGSGRAVVSALLARGHAVSALVRSPTHGFAAHPALSIVQGDALRAEDVARAVAGQDAVVDTLGITENPLRVRLLGPARTPADVRSRGTGHVVAAMQRHGVRRLVVQSSYGVGETRGRLGLLDRLFFALLLAPQIADTERQEQAVRESGLDWTLVQPVHLTSGPEEEEPFPSLRGEKQGLRLSRRSVARFVVEATTGSTYVHRSVALSRATAPSRRAERAAHA